MTAVHEDSFDFSQVSTSTRRLSHAAAAGSKMISSDTLTKALKFPMNRKSFTLRNSVALNNVLTPPDSPVLDGPLGLTPVQEAMFDTHSDHDHSDPISDDDVSPDAKSSAASSISIDFPFLRALHSFDASSLSSIAKDTALPRHDAGDVDPDPATICLSFEESDVALIHSVHPSGWGDATILSTGQRGWIPTNYFTPYAETKIIPLLSSVLTFVTAPKSYPLRTGPAGDAPMPKSHSSVFTFSQASITNIIAGVRSLLESCGTLTRDTPTVRRSQSIRKFRKSLLTELAILVSFAKQYRNSTDDNIIDKLVVVCYKIITKAVMFLDVWAVDANIYDDEKRDSAYGYVTYSAAATPDANPRSLGPEAPDAQLPSAPDTRPTSVMTVTSVVTSHSATGPSRSTSSLGLNAAIAAATATEKRSSVVFHSTPPMASRRLDEVNEALSTYLGIFIHRMSILQSDPTAATQVLLNTRKAMAACRELLSTVECISAKSLPRSRDLENSKDKLFIRIRTLVSAARDLVSASTADAVSDQTDFDKKAATEKLAQNATSCTQCACECVVRSRLILNRIGDFQLPAIRDYLDFSDGLTWSKRPEPETSALEESKSLEAIQEAIQEINLSSPSSLESLRSGSVGSDDATLTASDNMALLEDSSGRVRAASLEALLTLLTSEETEQDQFLASTFFLTFRLFSTPQDVVKILTQRYKLEVDDTTLDLPELESLSSRRLKIFNFVKRWMESHWIQSVDGAVLDELTSFSENFSDMFPNASLIISDLASKVVEVEDGEPIIPRPVALPGGNQTLAVAASALSSGSGKAPSRHQVNLLTRVNEMNGFNVEQGETPSVPEDDTKSVMSASTWVSSFRARTSLVGTSSIRGYHFESGTTGVSILDFDASEIAQQLTLVDSERFCRISSVELLDQNFSKKKRSLGLAPNVTQMVTASNQLSAFVGDSILAGDVPLKMRRNLLKQWIKIADKCLELRNFNSLMSIVSALQSVNIMRLKRTWDNLSPKYNALFQSLRKLLVPDKNFSYYRTMLREQLPPCIPYLGLYLSDLTFIDEGNPKFRLDKGVQLVNLDRYERVARLVAGLQQFQVPCKLPAYRELQTWLKGEMRRAHSSVTKDSNDLWRRSCIVEPRPTS